MRKKMSGGVLIAGLVLKPNPKPTLWYVEPIGQLTNQVLAEYFQEDRFVRRKLCVDGKRRNLWKASGIDIDCIEQSRASNDLLHYSVWYKSKVRRGVELWKKDRTAC